MSSMACKYSSLLLAELVASRMTANIEYGELSGNRLAGEYPSTTADGGPAIARRIASTQAALSSREVAIQSLLPPPLTLSSNTTPLDEDEGMTLQSDPLKGMSFLVILEPDFPSS
mmetsp:Transcript_32094/g.76705  ORF Transcript_32094/g.76705 Transcript_32094/m.76705 type:complete len:115 (-) Transcript_32094:599-943(-)